jgi:type I restriction-modification system DNA methylase subunit
MSRVEQKNKMAEVEKFKSAIPKIRHILRSCAVTGMDSMRHICLYMVGPYLTLENVKAFGIPEKFAWENRYNFLKEDEDISLQAFGNELIDHIDRLFQTQKLDFSIKSGTKHREIMEMLSSINIQEVDLHMDVLGYIYEQHLGTGASASRDLGQFFTDRFICEYMVELCAPKFKYQDVPESVCDPTMGTGGFLTAYLKYFKDKKVNWGKHQAQVHGVDHDAKVAGVARLNMFMESGGQIFKHLHTGDSLHGGLNPTTYDIILANMPFGLRGLTYAGCHESFRKKINIPGTKSEPLFLQLMMASLNKGGRCAVVVPDGMLVNSSKCHNDTRKYLLENFELKRIIKMKGKFFMNTGIEANIIFFENSGKKTKHVEFWDVERDDFGNVTKNEMALSVPIKDINEKYSLAIQKYKEFETVSYNKEIQIVKLGEILEPIKGKRHSVSEGKDSGNYPLICSSIDGKIRWLDTYEYEGPYLTVANGGFANFQVNEKFNASTHTLVYNVNSKYNLKYMCYVLSSMKEIINEKCFNGTGLKNLNISDFNKLEIPIPPLEVQVKIVKDIDELYRKREEALKIVNSTEENANSVMNSYLTN